MAYVAYDEAGNSATCSFKIHVVDSLCPAPKDPVGGIQRCGDWGPGGRFKVCTIECKPGMKFSTEVSLYYVYYIFCSFYLSIWLSYATIGLITNYINNCAQFEDFLIYFFIRCLNFIHVDLKVFGDPP